MFTLKITYIFKSCFVFVFDLIFLLFGAGFFPPKSRFFSSEVEEEENAKRKSVRVRVNVCFTT